MRISTSQIYQSALNSLLEQQAQLIRTQQQISTGKRILTPADDPAGAANLLGLGQSLQITQQYQQNINVARTQLAQEEATLGAVGNVLDRLRELALAAANATLTESDRRAIAIEVSQRLNDLDGLANTITPGGEYLFAGYQGLARPFSVDHAGNAVYHGDSGQRLLQIGPSRQIAVNDSGVAVFMAIPRGNGSFAALAQAGNAGSGVIDLGSVTGAYAGEAYTISFPAATAAAVPLSFGDAGGNDELAYSLSINGVEVYTVSASGTPAATLGELAAAINAHSGATGVRAAVDGGALYLTNTSPPGQTIEVAEAMSGASDGDDDTVTGYFGSVLTGATATEAALSYPLGDADAQFYLVQDAAGQVVASGAYTDGERIAFGGVQTRITGLPKTGDAFAIEPARNQDIFATVGGLLHALESGATGAALGNAVNAFLANVDQAMENARAVRAEVGGRLKALDTQAEINEDALLRLETARSGLEDVDYAAAISRFSRQMLGLEAAHKSFVQIQGLSLFNYVRF